MNQLPPPPPPPPPTGAPPPPPPPPAPGPGPGQGPKPEAGPTWALVVGFVLIALSLLVAIGSASRRDLAGGEAIGYVIGSLVGPFIVMMIGRIIWTSMQKKTAPIADPAWLVFGTGVIALIAGFGNAGKDADEKDSSAVPAIHVEARSHFEVRSGPRSATETVGYERARRNSAT